MELNLIKQTKLVKTFPSTGDIVLVQLFIGNKNTKSEGIWLKISENLGKGKYKGIAQYFPIYGKGYTQGDTINFDFINIKQVGYERV